MSESSDSTAPSSAMTTIRPKTPPTEMKFLDEGQVNRLLVASRNNWLEALYHLALTTGMRQMELLGLMWKDLDWINQTIKVDRQLFRPYGEGIKFAPLKTRFSRQPIPLGTRTMDILKLHHERQQSEMQVAGDKWIDHGLIIATTRGTPMHPSNLLRGF